MQAKSNYVASQSKLFAEGLTDICSEKKILEQHRAEWEDFRNAQRKGQNPPSIVTESFARTPPALVNLGDLEGERSSPNKADRKTRRTLMSSWNRTLFGEFRMDKNEFSAEEINLDENRRLPSASDVVDGDSSNAMRVDNISLDQAQTQNQEQEDYMFSDNLDETQLVTPKSLSQFVLSPPLNLSHLNEPKTSKSKIPTKIPLLKDDISPATSSEAYSEVLKKWMEDRRRWERCKKAYEAKLKFAEEKLRDQGMVASMRLQEMQLERKSADSRKLRANLKSARKKVSEIELHLQEKKDHVKYLEERCKILERREEANRVKWTEKSLIIAELKNKLAVLGQKLEEAQKKDNPELKKWKLKLEKSNEIVQKLEEKVRNQDRTQRDLQRRFDFEVQNGERFETTITRLTNENLLLRGDHQRLHLIQVELESARAAIKTHEENEYKLQDIKLENIGLRKSNSILTEQLELFERCNDRFKIELDGQNNEFLTPTLSQPNIMVQKLTSNPHNQTNLVISPRLNSVEILIPRSNQQASQPVVQTQGEGNTNNFDTSVKLKSLSPACSSVEPKKEDHSLPLERANIIFDTKPQPVQTPSGVQSVPLPASVNVNEMCERDIFFLKSLREMLTRQADPETDDTVGGNLDKNRKLLKSYPVCSQSAKTRARSRAKTTTSRKKGVKGNKLRKKRSNASTATGSKIKLIGKSVLANRKNTLRAF